MTKNKNILTFPILLFIGFIILLFKSNLAVFISLQTSIIFSIGIFFILLSFGILFFNYITNDTIDLTTEKDAKKEKKQTSSAKNKAETMKITPITDTPMPEQIKNENKKEEKKTSPEKMETENKKQEETAPPKKENAKNTSNISELKTIKQEEKEINKKTILDNAYKLKKHEQEKINLTKKYSKYSLQLGISVIILAFASFIFFSLFQDKTHYQNFFSYISAPSFLIFSILIIIAVYFFIINKRFRKQTHQMNLKYKKLKEKITKLEDALEKQNDKKQAHQIINTLNKKEKKIILSTK